MKNKRVNIQLDRRFAETKLSSIDVIRKRLRIAAEKKAAQDAEAETKAAEIKKAKADAEMEAARIKQAKADAEMEAEMKAAEIKQAAIELRIAKWNEAKAERIESDRRETDQRFHLEPLIYVDIYHPSRFGRNPNFNDFSRRILRLKDRPSEGRDEMVDYFLERLELIVPVDCLVICIPSSDPANQGRGISDIAERLCSGDRRHNADGILYRTEQIQAAHSGGPREISVHLETMKVKDPSIIFGKDVVLLDDITTSGKSLRAAGRKLHKCGARSITPVVIGRTYNGS